MTQADADAGTGALTAAQIAAYLGTDGQIIYVRLEENAIPTNYGTTSFVLHTVDLPVVTFAITGSSTVCNGDTTTITFTGTPNAVVTYTVDSGSNQTITLDGTGNAIIITPPLAVNSTYDLVSITYTDINAGTTTQPVSGSVTVTVTQPPVITHPTPYVVCDDSLNNDGFYCAFNLPTKNAEVTSNNTLTVAYYETLTDAQTGALPSIASPYCNIFPGTQTLYIRVFDPLAPNCYSIETLQLVINHVPVVNPVITDYVLCDYNSPGDLVEQFDLSTKDNEIKNSQPGTVVSYHLTQAEATAPTSNPLPLLYTSPSQTIWVNISDPATGCNSTGSFNLVVNPLPAANTPPTLFQCSNGASNQAVFNLTVNETTVTGGSTGVVVTYYNTLADAQSGTASIGNPLAYTGTDNEIVYIRVQNVATGCYATTTQLLRVTQGPLAVTPPALHYCDPNNDGFGVFDLDSVKNAIMGGIIDPNVTVGFYETATDALIGANPSLTSPYHNINPWTQTIYVRVYYTLTGCANYVQLQLIVDPTPEATTPSDYHLCDYTGATGYESFDLTTVIPQVLGSIDPALNTVTFFTTLADAQNNTSPISNVMGYVNTTITTQTIYVRVTTIATGCYDIVELRLVVDPLPNATLPNYAPYSLCDYTGAIGYETFDLASQINSILLGQTGVDVTFYPSLAEAQSDSNAITNLNYQNAIIYVQTLGIRLTNSTTHCYVVSTMDIRVNPLPQLIPQTSPYTLCDGNQDGVTSFDLTSLETDLDPSNIYDITFHETYTDAFLNGTTIPNPAAYFNNNPFVQTIYVRAEDPLTHCFSIMTIELNVNPSPIALTAVTLQDITLCDDQDNNNQDATLYLDLTVQTAAALLPQPGADSDYIVEYYDSLTNAQNGLLPITQADHYLGTNGQTIWVRVEDKVTGCYNLGSFKLIINIPLALTLPPALSMCDNDDPSNDQHYTFDLTVRDNQINNNTGYQVTYYTTAPVDASSVEITDPAHYYNTGVPTQTLGVVVTTPAGCKSQTTLDIRVLPVPTPPNENTIPVLKAVCENAPGSGVAVVDLTQNAPYIINGDPDVTLHYFPTEADMLANTAEITNPATAIVGDPSIAGATIGQVQYVYIAVTSSAFTDSNNRPCYKGVKQGFVVNPLPVVATIPDYQICESDLTGPGVGYEMFDLTSQINALLAGNNTNPQSTYSVAFYTDPTLLNQIADPVHFTNTTINGQPIYVQVTNVTPDTSPGAAPGAIVGCQSVAGSFNIVVNPKPLITVPAIMQNPYTSCDTDGDNDGAMLFPQSGNSPLPSLAGYVDEILGTQAAPTFIAEFYDNPTDADLGNSGAALTGLDTYQVQTGTYYIRVTNTVTGCYDVKPFSVVIEELAEPRIESNTGSYIACVPYNTTTVTNDLVLYVTNVTNPSNYTYNWYADGVLQTEHSDHIQITNINQDQVIYTVTATSLTSAGMLGCTSDITKLIPFTVYRSGPAANLTYTVTNAFEENQIITVTNDGYGVYEYSLDDGPRQTSNVFTNVSVGEHTVYVWDVRNPDYSCNVALIEGVQTIDYPHYFTPNGDGYHDYWNIRGLSYQKSAKIYIFDRYGKLIKQISSEGQGWDGTYNGKLMPADDYWFTVEYLEQTTAKEFKAHFSLQR